MSVSVVNELLYLVEIRIGELLSRVASLNTGAVHEDADLVAISENPGDK